jgi:integrase
VTTPRTTSRTIRIGDQLCRDIREYLMVTGKRGEDLLFSTSTGSPVSRNVFRTRVWLPAIERSGIRQRVRFHDLRGAHASWLLAGGADLKAVMDRLGHKQIQTTQQYLGRLPDADDRSRRLRVRPPPPLVAIRSVVLDLLRGERNTFARDPVRYAYNLKSCTLE